MGENGKRKRQATHVRPFGRKSSSRMGKIGGMQKPIRPWNIRGLTASIALRNQINFRVYQCYLNGAIFAEQVEDILLGCLYGHLPDKYLGLRAHYKPKDPDDRTAKGSRKGRKETLEPRLTWIDRAVHDLQFGSQEA